MENGVSVEDESDKEWHDSDGESFKFVDSTYYSFLRTNSVIWFDTFLSKFIYVLVVFEFRLPSRIRRRRKLQFGNTSQQIRGIIAELVANFCIHNFFAIPSTICRYFSVLCRVCVVGSTKCILLRRI